jgi:L-cystine uptake protein TcyP (sodium:dicarboxylate symporter family)
MVAEGFRGIIKLGNFVVNDFISLFFFFFFWSFIFISPDIFPIVFPPSLNILFPFLSFHFITLSFPYIRKCSIFLHASFNIHQM